MRTPRLVAGVVIGSSLLAGCSSGSDARAAMASATPTVSQQMRAYFDALASNDAARSRAGLVDAAPGSPAYRYLQYFAFSAGVRDVGAPPAVAAAIDVVSDDAVRLCEGADCGRFENVQVDDSGRVRDFTVDGKPFDQRLLIGGGTAVIAHAGTASLLASYQAGEGQNEHVIVSMTAHSSPIRVAMNEATFVTSDGSMLVPLASFGHASISSHSSTTLLWSFFTTAARGTLRLSGCAGSPCTRSWTAVIPV